MLSAPRTRRIGACLGLLLAALLLAAAAGSVGAAPARADGAGECGRGAGASGRGASHHRGRAALRPLRARAGSVTGPRARPHPLPRALRGRPGPAVHHHVPVVPPRAAPLQPLPHSARHAQGRPAARARHGHRHGGVGGPPCVHRAAHLRLLGPRERDVGPRAADGLPAGRRAGGVRLGRRVRAHRHPPAPHAAAAHHVRSRGRVHPGHLAGVRGRVPAHGRVRLVPAGLHRLLPPLVPGRWRATGCSSSRSTPGWTR